MSADADRIDECTRCHGMMRIDAGCEPTDLCHHCAQEHVEELTAELAEARKQLKSAHALLNDADGALQDAGIPVVDERFDHAIQRLHAERDAARAELSKSAHEHAVMRQRLEKTQVEAAALRRAMVHSWPDHGDADAPVEAGSVCLDCGNECEENEVVDHAEGCSMRTDTGRALAARVPLLEAASKLNDLRRQCAVELFDRGFIDDAHEDDCPEDDTCECALMPLMHAVLNDDDAVNVDAAETALAWCAKHSDVCTPTDCVCISDKKGGD